MAARPGVPPEEQVGVEGGAADVLAVAPVAENLGGGRGAVQPVRVGLEGAGASTGASSRPPGPGVRTSHDALEDCR